MNALLLAALLAAPVPFEGIERPAWNWKAAAASYGSVVAADYLLTVRCERAGMCVEGNGNGSKPALAVGGFAAAMVADFLAFRYVHPRAPWVLRVGFAGHRGMAQFRVDVTW